MSQKPKMISKLLEPIFLDDTTHNLLIETGMLMSLEFVNFEASWSKPGQKRTAWSGVIFEVKG